MSTHTTRPAAAWQDGRWTKLPDALLSVLTPREHQLVHALLSYRWTDDAAIYPSVKTLARQIGCSVRTVQRTTASLVDKGYLLVEARYRGDEGQTSNLYRPGLLLAPLLAYPAAPDATRPDQAWHRGVPPVADKRNSRNDNTRTNRNQPGYRQSKARTDYTNGALGPYIHR